MFEHGIVRMTFEDGNVFTFALENWKYWTYYWPNIKNFTIDWK